MPIYFPLHRARAVIRDITNIPFNGLSMLHQPNLSNQPAPRLASLAISQLEASSPTPKSRGWTAHSEMVVDELAFRPLVAFRGQSHINNVLTHVSGDNWKRVEQELRAIFDPVTEHADLSPLAHNILDLMCAERGVTGRIQKPFFDSFVHGLLEQELAKQTIRRLTALYLGVHGMAGEAADAHTNSMRGGAMG